MNIRRLIALFPLIVLLTASFAYFVPVDTLQVRLFANLKVSSIHIYAPVSGYRIIGDGQETLRMKSGIDYRFEYSEGMISVRENEKVIGKFRFLRLISDKPSELKIKLVNPERRVRTYQDNFTVGISEDALRVINEVELDNYIAGVTEAEAGTRCNMEFYKVQALLARTFALSHINKHVTEGFSLCDQVHCQAYYGKPRDPNIMKAVDFTRGKVVVDENLNLIVAAFHSNSGGQTANSEDVWGSATPYLKSIVDTFSTRMPNYTWERKMHAGDWLAYLKDKHNFPIENDSGRLAALNFTQDNRKTYLEYSTTRVPLKNVRQDLHLRSTFFSVTKLGADSVVFRGRGYGHGLGMCQEGAMKMSRCGYTHQDILNFYYQRVQIIDLQKLVFFRDE